MSDLLSYSERMRIRFRQTGQGMPVHLRDGTWWSRGWKGCPTCEGSVHVAVRLHRFSETRNGLTVTGWRCRP